MFGLPNQTLEDVKESLNYILKINPEHISCYSLILHKDTKKELPTDDEEREMYHYILKTLKNAGYVHYEISNFAKKGFESKHNLVYWNQEEYAGVGAGASSYVDSVRYTNERNIERYILENKRDCLTSYCVRYGKLVGEKYEETSRNIWFILVLCLRKAKYFSKKAQ